MGLFKKKESKKEEPPRLPEIPKLPDLPEFSVIEEKQEEQVLPQLPSFPTGTLGNKFSQNTIKEAVSGKKEERANDFADEEEETLHLMQKPLIKESVGKEYFSRQEKTKIKEEPIFIRIDRFEEGSQTFEEVKKQVDNLEKMLGEVKKVKEQEDKELEIWEAEIKQVKEKIENIDNNIFSKIE